MNNILLMTSGVFFFVSFPAILVAVVFGFATEGVLNKERKIERALESIERKISEIISMNSHK